MAKIFKIIGKHIIGLYLLGIALFWSLIWVVFNFDMYLSIIATYTHLLCCTDSLLWIDVFFFKTKIYVFPPAF